jgi:glycosyltransferase involved in cell wall biosynthesis
MSNPTISVILPIYNQADHVEPIVTAYREHLQKVPATTEIILVPNGSSDRSEETCHSLARKFDNVRTLSVQEGGWGIAVRRGLGTANGDILCYTNSARTSPEELVLMLLYAVAYPQVVVKANRKVRESARRRLGSLLYNLECRTLFDLSYWDINGTPKVFPRRFDKLLGLTRNDDLIDLEFNVICRKMNYPVVEVPIFSSRRHGGKSTTTYLSAVHLYLGAYTMWRAQKSN